MRLAEELEMILKQKRTNKNIVVNTGVQIMCKRQVFRHAKNKGKKE